MQSLGDGVESSLPFAIRRIYCVGKNYDAHAREMGWEGTREPPFYFTKFPDTLAYSGQCLSYPPETTDFQYEGELVVALGAAVFRVAPQDALSAVWGYAAGLDMTRRDLQGAARKAGRPWDLGKNFDQAAVIGPLRPAMHCGHLVHGSIRLTANEEVRQNANLSDMIFNVAEIIADLSRFGPLAQGDLIFTGTPAGVGPVEPGDRIVVTVADLAPCAVTIGPRL